MANKASPTFATLTQLAEKTFTQIQLAEKTLLRFNLKKNKWKGNITFIEQAAKVNKQRQRLERWIPLFLPLASQFHEKLPSANPESQNS